MLSKVIGDQTTIPTMLFFRNVLGLVIIIPWIVKYWPKSTRLNNPKIVLLRAIMGLTNLCLIFLAIQKISLVNTTLLNNSAPFFVPIIVWFWLRKPLDFKLWPAIVVGFIGIALILQPDKRILNMGALYALLSGVCLAVSLITMRLSSRSETLHSFLLYFFGIGFIITLPFAALDWKIENGLTLLGLLSMGLFSAIGQILLFHGLKLGQARQLAPFTYATVIFAGIYEWLIWGVIPKPIAYFGIVLIIAAGIWIVYTTRPPETQ